MFDWFLWQSLENKRQLPKLYLGRSYNADVRHTVSENNWSQESIKNTSMQWYSQLGEKGLNHCKQTKQLLQISQKAILSPSYLQTSKEAISIGLFTVQPFGNVMCRNRWRASLCRACKGGQKAMGALSLLWIHKLCVFTQLFPFV